MSYDVYTDDGSVDWNYTTNCAPMWRAAGLDLVEFAGKPASECVLDLAAALIVLALNARRFEAMNPPNGWGSYGSLLPALADLLEQLRSASDQPVRVSL